MAKPWVHPADYDATPRPVVATGNKYPPSFELDWRQHGRGQLLYAAAGVAVVSTPHGAWIAPPERAVWTLAGTPHSVRMVGAVSTRSVLLDARASKALGDARRVIGVSPLMRHLLIAACDIPVDYDEAGRDGLVMDLLLAELSRAPVIPLAVPFPALPALPRLAAGEPVTTIALDLGYDSPAAFSTMFKRLLGIPPNRYKPGGAGAGFD